MDGGIGRLDMPPGYAGKPLETNVIALPQNVQHARTKDGPSMLVRPDGCIAWTDASSKSLDDALARWF
jgi:hypothetical protein